MGSIGKLTTNLRPSKNRSYNKKSDEEERIESLGYTYHWEFTYTLGIYKVWIKHHNEYIFNSETNIIDIMGRIEDHQKLINL